MLSRKLSYKDHKKRREIARQELSVDQQSLLKLMQSINFGCIEQLRVKKGQPVLNPPPKSIREVKFGAENGPRPEASLDDFTLKSQTRELIEAILEIGDGVIERIEIRHGLPFRMIIEGHSA